MNRSCFSKIIVVAFLTSSTLAWASDAKKDCPTVEGKLTLDQTIANALCLAKNDYFKVSLAGLDKINKELTPDQKSLDRVALTKIIVQYHRYQYYKAQNSKVAKDSAATLSRAADEFLKTCSDNKLTRLALSMQAKVSFSEGNYEVAGNIWTSVLHKDPPDNLFHESMIGIIRSENALGNYEHVISSVKQFLVRYADLISGARKQALLDELAKSAIEYSDKLAKENKQIEAANVLAQVATAVPGINLEAKIVLQQAYYFARGQQWDSVIRSCDTLINNEKIDEDDRATAAYLKARAFEYKLELQTAANEMLKFSKTYPKHSRAIAAAHRAAELFAGEGQFKKAAIASLQAAKIDLADTNKEFLQATDYLVMAGDIATAKTIVSKIDAENFDTLDSARYDLLAGKILIQTQAIDNGIAQLTKLTDLTSSSDLALKKIGADANLTIAKSWVTEFEAIKLEGQVETVKERYLEKAALYDEKISKSLQRVMETGIPQFQTQAAQTLAKISLNFQQEIDYASNFITTDIVLRQNMKNYSRVISRMTPQYFRGQQAVGLRVPEHFQKPEVEPAKIKNPFEQQKQYRKIKFFDDNSLGSF